MESALDDAVRRTVDASIASGDLLNVEAESKRLAEAHPASGLDAGAIAELLFKAGVSARVPLSWGADK